MILAIVKVFPDPVTHQRVCQSCQSSMYFVRDVIAWAWSPAGEYLLLSVKIVSCVITIFLKNALLYFTYNTLRKKKNFEKSISKLALRNFLWYTIANYIVKLCVFMIHPYKNILKIVIISLIFLWGYKAFIYASSWEIVATKVQESNATRFQAANAQQFLNISAAISTRIGIAYNENGGNNLSWSFYEQIADIGTSKEEKKEIRKKLIAQNMLIIWEYLNLSQTDIKSLLDSSNDRERTLEWFISQLELRQRNSRLSMQSLELHKDLLVAELDNLSSQIESVKSDMEWAFSSGNSWQTLSEIDQYFELRELYTIAFTDIVFMNQFLKQHDFLTRYNLWILNTLKTNKQAIIDETFVVIPSSWSEYLRPLELLFDEAEIQN